MRRACLAAIIAIAGFLLANPARLEAQTHVAIDNDDIGGVVTGPKGPEAGVWVIAETHDLPTRYAKMVVTDDQGRFVVPDLPKAQISGLGPRLWPCQFAKVDAAPGQHLALTAVPAPDDASAAQYYPAIYWFAMLKIPDKDQFGGKSDIPENVTQNAWLTDDQEPGLRRLPSARSAVDPHHPNGARHVQKRRRRLDAPRAVRPGVAADGQPARRTSSAAFRSNISAIGPIASPRANCRSPSRRGRPASSAMSSSRPGTGATTSIIFTT